jgi:hypothetical protein
MSRAREEWKRVAVEQIYVYCLRAVRLKRADLDQRQHDDAWEDVDQRQRWRRMEVDAFACSSSDRCDQETERAACLCIERDECRTARMLAFLLCPHILCSDHQRPPNPLHIIRAHTPENMIVSLRAVHRGAQAIISCYSPATSVNGKSADGGEEAAVDAAEERASSDCASEGAGEVCSSTVVSMTADMMRCVHKRSEKVREER